MLICFSTLSALPGRWLPANVVRLQVVDRTLQITHGRRVFGQCRLLLRCLLLRLRRCGLGCRRCLLCLLQLLVAIAQLLLQLLNLVLHIFPQRLNLALYRRLLGYRGLSGVVRLWVELLVVPDAVVCASPADSAETSASVASVFSWFFIWPLFAV